VIDGGNTLQELKTDQVGDHRHRRDRAAFAGELTRTDSGEVAAVGSRRLESAQAFGAGPRDGSYEALVSDPRSTPSTSPRRTRSTTPTRGSRWSRQARCSSRRRSR